MIGSRTVGPVAITGSVGGTAITNTSVYYWPGSLSAIDENLSSVELGFGVTAGTIHVVFAHVEGDGTLSLVSEQTILAVAGPSSVNSGLSILKPAGSVMGLQRTGSGTWYYTAGAIPNGEAEWFTAAVPTSNTAKTIGFTSGPQWKATFTGEIGVKARAAYASANELADIVGSEQVVGWPSLVNTGTNTPSNYSVVMQTPAPSDGYITEVNAGASGSGCHWALASNRPAHWFNRVTQFANVSIADDEPGMTALRPSSTYTPAFYGVTTSGTVSTGTRGPLGESIILADGASLAFTGAYEQVGVHHTQDAGQGSLAFAFAFNGGAAYKTVNAAGALALDQYSGPSLTGQAASGNYTLTVAGGPVEITGLIRLGIKAAGSRPRLRTPRAARRARKLYIRVLQRAAPCFCGRTMRLCWRQDRAGPRPGHQRQLWHAAGDDFNEHHVDHQHAGSGPGAANARPRLGMAAIRAAEHTTQRLARSAKPTRSRNVPTIPIDGFDYISSGAYQKACTSTTPATTAMHCASSKYVAERG
ncbi:hypothetical protein CIT31_11995 [Mesorhizobium wenxiniae]|uniref:Uncharacterized protein n=1 Tax=Mesorhizobium wenxiniae TaxID=2014805 RepID=A0A271KHC2_9HYPH|nr:hypothetical protein CIT31_11995 [Mesorhizobium wenxiniae]